MEYGSLQVRIQDVTALDIARSIGILSDFPQDSKVYEFEHLWSKDRDGQHTDKNYSSVSVWHTESVNEYRKRHSGFERLSFIMELEPDLIVSRVEGNIYNIKFSGRVDGNAVRMVNKEIIRIHRTGFV